VSSDACMDPPANLEEALAMFDEQFDGKCDRKFRGPIYRLNACLVYIYLYFSFALCGFAILFVFCHLAVHSPQVVQCGACSCAQRQDLYCLAGVAKAWPGQA
jgi:hypothetical protein